jgi:uncharacterized protein YfbU (UPF0304 family)
MKADVTINRQITINTGNFSAVRPSVSVTLKDVDANKMSDNYKRLETIVDGLFALEMATLLKDQDDLNGIPINLKKIIDSIEEHRDQIFESLEEDIFKV